MSTADTATSITASSAPPCVIHVDVKHAPESLHDHAALDAAYNKAETFGTLGLKDGNAPNLDWILSEPLLAAALQQTTHLDHLTSLETSIQVALQNSGSGKQLPHDLHAKLAEKRAQLTKQFIQEHATHWFLESGLLPIVAAKRKWDDVHWMAEAHGVGSSVPMVNYTDLSQTHVEWCFYSFYQHLHRIAAAGTKYPNLDTALVKASTEDKADLQQIIATQVCNAYADLYESMTGEFGGYTPFANMVHHTPKQVRGMLGLEQLTEQELESTSIPLENDGLEEKAKAERAELAQKAYQQAQEYVAALKLRPPPKPSGDAESSDDDYEIEDPSQRYPLVADHGAEDHDQDYTEATAGEEADENGGSSFFACFKDH